MEGGLASLARPFLRLFARKRDNIHEGSRRNIAAHYDLGNAGDARPQIAATSPGRARSRFGRA